MTSAQPPEKIYIRFSESGDAARIVDFYEKNRSPYVFLRERAVWEERIAAGAVTIAENGRGEILASTISYPLAVKNEAGEEARQWTEIGSTLVARNGIGLFPPLVSAQILRAFLYEPPEDGFILEIVTKNQRSIDVFEKLGAAPFALPQGLFDQVQETFAEGKDREVRWYRIGPEAVPALAQNILAASRLTDGRTGETFDLDFSRMPQVSAADLRQLAGENTFQSLRAAKAFPGARP